MSRLGCTFVSLYFPTLYKVPSTLLDSWCCFEYNPYHFKKSFFKKMQSGRWFKRVSRHCKIFIISFVSPLADLLLLSLVSMIWFFRSHISLMYIIESVIHITANSCIYEDVNFAKLVFHAICYGFHPTRSKIAYWDNHHIGEPLIWFKILCILVVQSYKQLLCTL